MKDQSRHRNVFCSWKIFLSHIRGREFAKIYINEEDYVLRHMNLQIYKQEFLAITGKNGVGKTTLMRVIFQIFRQNEA